MVSHDRHLLRTVSDEFYIVHGGRAQPFDGDLEDYAKWLADAEAAPAVQHAAAALKPNETTRKAQPAPGEGSTRAPAVAETAESRKQRKREEADRRNRLTPLKEAIARCERELEELAREKAEVQAKLATPGLYSEAEKPRLQELLQREAQIAKATSEAEARWLESTEQLESLAREA